MCCIQYHTSTVCWSAGTVLYVAICCIQLTTLYVDRSVKLAGCYPNCVLHTVPHYTDLSNVLAVTVSSCLLLTVPHYQIDRSARLLNCQDQLGTNFIVYRKLKRCVVSCCSSLRQLTLKDTTSAILHKFNHSFRICSVPSKKPPPLSSLSHAIFTKLSVKSLSSSLKFSTYMKNAFTQHCISMSRRKGSYSQVTAMFYLNLVVQNIQICLP